MPRTMSIVAPSNFHGHLRDPDDPEEMPEERLFWHLLPYTLAQFGQGYYVHFGNYKPGARPIVDAERVLHNRGIVLPEARRLGYPGFRLLSTIMITRDTTPAIIHEAADVGIYGGKTLPAHGTNNSHAGREDFSSSAWHDILTVLEERDIPWLVHAETPDPNMPKAEREADFIRFLADALDRHPRLRIAFEHLTTKEGVKFIWDAGGRVIAHVDPHHLYETDQSADADPFLQCAPYPKSWEHVEAVRALVLSGSPYVAHGDDSAPHPWWKKLVTPPQTPAFGVYHPASVAVMAQFFDEHRRLDLFEPVMSLNGPRWHGLPIPEGRMTLVERTWRVPPEYHGVVPYRRDRELHWDWERPEPT